MKPKLFGRWRDNLKADRIGTCPLENLKSDVADAKLPVLSAVYQMTQGCMFIMTD